MLEGLTVFDLLTQMSEILQRALSAEDDTTSMFDPDSDVDMEDNFDFSDNDDEHGLSTKHASRDFSGADALGEFSTTGDHPILRAKISGDLRQAKLAGFKVGYLGNVSGQVIVSISCRVAKLGISHEAMQAWGLNPRQYLVFLIRYQKEYRNLDEILLDDRAGAKPVPEMQVALCDSYKPSYSVALGAFLGVLTFGAQPEKVTPSDQETDDHPLIRSFISKPLNTLLNERFVKILRYRLSHGLGWSGAELFYNDTQGKHIGSADSPGTQYTSPKMQEAPITSLPGLATADHVQQTLSSSRSFPLIGMQFVLRHFVRCTEFCLVCHCKINANFEALKPYVCSKSLCLFQYMALGFGPSLEWEIMSQPYVVDLLISFTYSSAKASRLRDFPTGLGILVPPGLDSAQSSTTLSHTPEAKPNPNTHFAKLDPPNMELVFPDSNSSSPLCVGDWIMIVRHLSGEHLHCRVQETSFWPRVKLTEPIRLSSLNAQKPKIDQGPEDVRFFIYNENFDGLSVERKCTIIVTLLDTLPDVGLMKDFLEKQQSTELSLAKWRDRISKSALDVLRWIVASNRSCIIQDEQSIPGNQANQNSTSVSETRVSGMEGYMQFRFAQGAPDKEQRFVDAVTKATKRLSLDFPTLFAWHGSSLCNWHGIVREGLHFKEITNGRAFGNGVYMSSHFYVSSGYTGTRFPHNGSHAWPQSQLKITSAISLNEVVNSPSEFVSKTPHLVVSKLDWIQPRYLFVQCQSLPAASQSRIKAPSAFYKQDPKFTAHGPDNQAIVVPITAVSQRRRNETLNNKAQKKTGHTLQQAPDEEVSDATDDEDREILNPILDKVEAGHVDKKKATSNLNGSLSNTPKTDFIPGSLSVSSLPVLLAPAYATTGATKALQRDLRTTLKIQETEPLHELGWYIDSNLINTVYQWIVELHSFDPKLPLAADLKAAGLKSVVMELRFSNDYPMSPPFARIIRPRFLGFMQGGGGHVTAGGALCMELLTNSGWSAVSSIESVLLQIRLALSSTDPKPARLEANQCGRGGRVMEYSVMEAVQAYIRACNAHGWEVPKEFERMGRLELATPGSSK